LMDFFTGQPMEAMDNLKRMAKAAGEMAGHIRKFADDKDNEDKAETDPFFDEFARQFVAMNGEKPARRAAPRRDDSKPKLLPGSGFLQLG